MIPRLRALVVGIVAAAVTMLSAYNQTTSVQDTQDKPGPAGVREACWSPDGKRIAATWYDAVWTMTPEGRDQKRVATKHDEFIVERDPAWSKNGEIAMAVDVRGEFDIWIAPANGGTPRRITTMPGDERWPSWTADGRIVFSHRAPKGIWQLFVINADGAATPVKLTPDDAEEWQGRVSPDGKLVAFVSNREGGGDDFDVWIRELSGATSTDAKPKSTRVTADSARESFPAWAPDSARIAYSSARPGQSGVLVSKVPNVDAAAPRAGAGRGGRGRGFGAAGPIAPASTSASPDAPVWASLHAGVPAWSPDGRDLLIATSRSLTAGYNGNPDRNDDEPPMALLDARDFALWRTAAPRALDEGAHALTLPNADRSRWLSAFDQVWQTVRSLYYLTGPTAIAWDALREKYRPRATNATSDTEAEDVIDALIAEQPLIKPAIVSSKGVVASGSPLASQAGADMLARGGNVVDAGIAVAVALGVVEPDATSLGGDGQAILFLKGMSEPVVVEYKDMTPGHATTDNPKLFTATGGRTAPDGPTVANIPGVAAGLDLLYEKYASKKIPWAELVAPAIKLADDGFVLDEALPTSIGEAHAQFAKYPETAKVFLPGGQRPKPGDRFVNHDYAETLRILAKEGAQSFYRGTIARRIADDMAANGGVITADDLAQYRAMERKPLLGHYRGHAIYSVPAPVSNGAAMVETFNILDNYKPRSNATLASDPDYFHYLIEAWRVRDGSGRIADPERWPVDYGNHLDPAHAVERFKLIDPSKAYVAPTGGRGGEPIPLEYQSEDESGRIQTGTTAFVVADADGNMIAFTQTLSTWGGNFYVSKGLGFLYNDHFRGGAGRGGGFGSLLPLTRSSSTSVPTLVFAPATDGNDRYGISGYVPRLATGCAGNAWIPASVYTIIANVIDGRMDAQHAIEAPRVLIGGGAGGRSNVQIEDRIPRSILANLEARGHTFTKVGRKGEVKYGYAALAVIDTRSGRVEAGAEPRRSHGAATPDR